MHNRVMNKLKEELEINNIVVEKHGGDKFLWFLREGGITRELNEKFYKNFKKLVESLKERFTDLAFESELQKGLDFETVQTF